MKNRSVIDKNSVEDSQTTPIEKYGGKYPGLMANIAVDKISFVNQPANNREFLLIKSVGKSKPFIPSVQNDSSNNNNNTALGLTDGNTDSKENVDMKKGNTDPGAVDANAANQNDKDVSKQDTNQVLEKSSGNDNGNGNGNTSDNDVNTPITLTKGDLQEIIKSAVNSSPVMESLVADVKLLKEQNEATTLIQKSVGIATKYKLNVEDVSQVQNACNTPSAEQAFTNILDTMTGQPRTEIAKSVSNASSNGGDASAVQQIAQLLNTQISKSGTPTATSANVEAIETDFEKRNLADAAKLGKEDPTLSGEEKLKLAMAADPVAQRQYADEINQQNSSSQVALQ